MNGVKFKQVWDGFVYHMTSRGSRRNTLDKAKNIYEDSPEWLAQNQRSTRNFIRKWGHFVMHDALMKPIVPNKYDVGFLIKNCNKNLLGALEPWCDNIYVDCDFVSYVLEEQPNTKIDLQDRVKGQDIALAPRDNDIIVEIDSTKFDNNDFNTIQKLSQILDQQGETGKFKLGNLFITINKVDTYTNNLIKL